MMLNKIKTVECPICGCTTIIEESVKTSSVGKPEILKHCMGGQWETRKFLCGYKVNYEPNYLKEVESSLSECYYNPEVIARKAKEASDKERLIQVLLDNNISEKLVGRIKSYCL